MGKVIWLTGLSGSGKTTISKALKKELKQPTLILDGDIVRKGLSSDLIFDDKSRNENVRRVAEISKMIVEQGVNVIVSMISPFDSNRKNAKSLIGKAFLLVHVDCPLSVCRNRDVKGLYNLSKENKLLNFTGVDSPYEEPKDADVVVMTNFNSVSECVNQIITFLSKNVD